MTWPNTQGTKEAIAESETPNPANARPELETLYAIVSEIIDSRGVAEGVPSLNSSGKIPISQLPASALGGLPIGTVIPFCGATVPSKFLICDGSAVDRSTHSLLYSVIGDTFGDGDGSTTFNVPDLRDRVLVGKDDMGGSPASRITAAAAGIDGKITGATGGVDRVTLVIDNLPGHQHRSGGDENRLAQEGNQFYWTGGTDNFGGAAGEINVVDSGQSLDIGGDEPHPNVQPSSVVNFIIYSSQ